MVLRFDAMHDEEWTRRAVMGWENQLEKLAGCSSVERRYSVYPNLRSSCFRSAPSGLSIRTAAISMGWRWPGSAQADAYSGSFRVILKL